MSEPVTSDAIHRALGLTDDEAAAIERLLGRAPNHLELAMYAVMWSEHCSYKSSRIHLKRLPSEGADVLVGPGENAGVVDVGDGIAVAFRIESHNHPSAIEPYQGAATGIGGILRDVFTMGARPIALMDPLRFGPLDDPRSRWITIAGVVADMRRRGLHQGARLEAFGSTTQNIGRSMQLLVAAEGKPFALAPAVRAEIRSLDPSGPITDVSTVEADIGESLAVRRFQALLLALFSLLAVLLAAVGIFGLMAQVVVRRTPEIGLRMALGASPRDVLTMVLRQGVRLAAVGAVAGICGAFAIARVLNSVLFGISPADPISYTGAALVMGLAVLLACGLPAWRAARVDPMVALRNDG